ncbi:hypothetical protein [Thalassotalea sp. Y01]|uniref:hypothetical protein n=1 Tax=Thalassotalea sp. Y01 TaxID=2729613 RepID=UPI00145EA11E|nr:hypothetical protein [Thalassotalea sp. Y01]NMP17016.1 hypothetical protein [Thalassotalea sp. Y01]
MTDTTSHLKTPGIIVSKAVIYLGLLLATMALLVGTSLWLYNQQANKAQFLKQQQIPFIKNNAQLMKSVAELENQLVAQQLAIRHQQLEQPLEDLKVAWEEIVELSKHHVDMVNDNLRDNNAEEIAATAQSFANGYKRFVNLVDDLILIRQSRNNQYNANVATLKEIVHSVDLLRNAKLNELNSQSFAFVNKQSRVQTQSLNEMLAVMNKAQFYQHIYQELLKVENQITALSSMVTAHKFNQVSTQIANLTRNINKELHSRKADPDLEQVQDDIAAITNQLMGSGQLFAKWRDENITTAKVIEQLRDYQSFLAETVDLIEKPNFYDLPEFELNLPVFSVRVKESTMMPVAFLFILVLLSFSSFIAWRLFMLVTRSYKAGAKYMDSEHEKEKAAEQALLNVKVKEKQQLEHILDGVAKPKEATENAGVKEIDFESEESSPSFYKVNNLVMNLDKFNQYHGSAEMAVYMLDDYIERNNKNFAKLKEALAHENLPQVSQVNNAILKIANILSAPRLIKVCEQMQSVCQRQKMHQAIPLLIEMNSAIKEVSEYVAEA